MLPVRLAMPGPHDLFARFTFGHPERAEAELRAVLPSQVVSEVDWSSLRRESGSVVDPELRETESDLLFSARMREGRPLLLYVLLEHQSSVDRWMALRMLRYVVRQVEHWRQQHPESPVLPVIIPLVMFHGLDGAWSAPRRVEELFDLPGDDEQRERWRALVPRFEYLLDDLTAERAEALMARPGPPLVRLAWRVLRYGRTGELAHRLPKWTALFAQMRAGPDGAEYLVVVIHYLLSIGSKATLAAAKQVLHSVMNSQQAEALMERWVEEYMRRGPEAARRVLREEGLEEGRQEGLEEGRQKGRQEGRQEGRKEGREEGLAQGLLQGRAEAVLRILSARGVQVGEEARQRILACTDMATLDRWFDKSLNATRLSDVLEDLSS